MKISKDKIEIIKLDVSRIDEYIEFVENIKNEMEHNEWLGDFTKEDYVSLLSNGSKIFIWQYEDKIIASGMLIPSTQK